MWYGTAAGVGNVHNLCVMIILQGFSDGGKSKLVRSISQIGGWGGGGVQLDINQLIIVKYTYISSYTHHIRLHLTYHSQNSTIICAYLSYPVCI